MEIPKDKDGKYPSYVWPGVRDGVTDAEAVAILQQKPDAELSRMLGVVQAQIPTAAAQGNDIALSRLQQHENVITAARVAKMEAANPIAAKLRAAADRLSAGIQGDAPAAVGVVTAQRCRTLREANYAYVKNGIVEDTILITNLKTKEIEIWQHNENGSDVLLWLGRRYEFMRVLADILS